MLQRGAPMLVLMPIATVHDSLGMQVCLATLMAQAGAWVPAESLDLTPADAVFVRMGARDAIMSGQVHNSLPS